MKLMGILCAVAVCTVGLGAQSKETETKSKITVKDGKSVTVSGCVASSGASGFILTNVADKTGALPDYVLVSDEGEIVEARGTSCAVEWHGDGPR